MAATAAALTMKDIEGGRSAQKRRQSGGTVTATTVYANCGGGRGRCSWAEGTCSPVLAVWREHSVVAKQMSSGGISAACDRETASERCSRLGMPGALCLAR